MPRMIPSRPDAGCAASERKVFERFEKALPSDWTVFQGRQIVLPATKNATSRSCETDFLVLDPSRGVLALEVKGGGVQRESDDLWYWIDAAGNAHEIRNPQKQVTSAVYALRDWIAETPTFENVYLPAVWGVVFPDITVNNALGPDLPRELIVDQHDLAGDVTAAIDRVFDSSVILSRRSPGGAKDGEGPPAHMPGVQTPLDTRRERAVLSALAPAFRVIPLLSDKIANAEQQLVRMTEEQHRIFDFLGDAPRLKVRGSAGSGKTLVAMEKARRDAVSGRRVLFLCFNALLAEWLRNATQFAVASSLTATREVRASSPAAAGRPRPAAVASPRRSSADEDELIIECGTFLPLLRGGRTSVRRQSDFSPTAADPVITILTFHDLARQLAKEARIPFVIPSDAKDKQAFWSDKAPDILIEAAEKLGAHWDTIVIDEAQDFRTLWWLAIERLLGPQSSALTPVLWAFYDPNQDIYGADSLATLNCADAMLAKNCRNSARIAAHAYAEVGEEPELHASAPDGVPVETIRCADEAEMKDAVRRTLHRLVHDEKLDPARIVVLTASAADKSLLKGQTLANLKLVDWPATNKNEIGYCSLQRFKGLEADAIVLCEVDRTKQNATPKHLYVAGTRAKHVLVVAEYGSAGAEGGSA